MNCINCGDKICRTQQTSCGRENFVKSEEIHHYNDPSNKEIVKAASLLVDNGRAGTLSRIEEIMEYSKTMKYSKIGLAYCYGMEKIAKAVQNILMNGGFSVAGIACSVGGLKQSEVNPSSCIHKVSCNPLGQAHQLNSEKVDLTLIIGICLGHDIILNKNLDMDFTTLVVKDRVNHNNPIMGL
jgi:uncharacterized metal-binding protein